MTLKPASAPVRKSVEHNVAASELVVYKMVANERGATFANVLGLFYYYYFFFSSSRVHRDFSLFYLNM